MLHKLMDALAARDYLAVTQCFEGERTDRYIDHCPAMVQRDPIALYGANAIEMWFRNEFYHFNQSFEISQVRFLDEKTATCFTRYHDRYCFARFTLEELGSSGKIKRVSVRPE